MSRTGRILGYLALVLAAGVVVAAVVAHIEREALARGIVNRLLKDHGIVATRLSIESLGTDELKLSRLVLEADGGTIYDLRDLSMPVSLPSMRPELVRVGSMSVRPGTGTGPEPLRPAGALRALLALPGAAPNTAIAVGRLSWAGLPPLEGLVWHATEDRQRLEFAALGLALSIGVTGSDAAGHVFRASAMAGGLEVGQAELSATARDLAYDVSGSLALDLAGLGAMDTGNAPGKLEPAAGRLDATLEATLDDDAPSTAAGAVSILVAGGTALGLRPGDRPPIDVRLERDLAATVHFDFAATDGAMNWSLAAASASAAVGIKGVGEVALRLADLDCAKAGSCSVTSDIRADRLDLVGLRADDVAVESRLVFDFREPTSLRLEGVTATSGVIGDDLWSVGTLAAASAGTIEIEFAPEGLRARLPQLKIDAGSLRYDTIAVASLEFAGDANLEPGAPPSLRLDNLPASAVGLAADAWSARGLTLTEPASVLVSLGDPGWRAETARAALRVDVLEAGGAFSASLPVTLTAVGVEDSGAAVSARYSVAPRATTLQWGETELVAPAIDGTFRIADTWSAEMALSNAAGSTAAALTFVHDPAAGTGSLRIADGALDFELTPMSKRVRHWSEAWDLVRGRLTGDASIKWRDLDGDLVFDGDGRATADEIAGSYGDIAFTGLAGSMRFVVDPAQGFRGEEAAMTLDLLDIGVPVEHLAAGVRWDVAGDSLEVGNLGLDVLGGRVSAEPFSYRVGPGEAAVILAVESVQLPLIVALAEFESIDMTGSLSGVLPVSVAGKTITVSGGHLVSDPPGGAIRYLGGTVNPADTSGLGVVERALSNFRYDSLTSDVNYTEEGDLKVRMRMTGVNPDMDERQPVILNLSVENNVPQLLRSLQATRAIEDVLEKRRN